MAVAGLLQVVAFCISNDVGLGQTVAVMIELTDQLNESIQGATAALLARRNGEGYWEGRLASSPLATAVALCAFGYGKSPLPEAAQKKSFAYLASTQNKDGGWGDTEISKSNLAATLLVLCADALARADPSPRVRSAHVGPLPQGERGAVRDALTDEQRARGWAYAEKLGGLRDGLKRVYGKDLTFQVPIRMTAACAGLIPWSDVDALPFELALAPRGLMGALRLPVVSYALPALVCVGLARHAKKPSWFLPSRWLRSSITQKALDLILKMQPASGGYLEAIPITAFCMLGLTAAGREDHPIAQNAQKFLLNTQREDGSWPVEVNLSIWNTTRAIEAFAAGDLLNSALPQTERDKTRDWILARQTTGTSVYSDAQPGGWGWNHLSGSVPDVDDTSGAILALRELGVQEESLLDGRLWIGRLQNRDGGWPTFCRGWNKLPFDKSAPDLTAHALRAWDRLSTLEYEIVMLESWLKVQGLKYLNSNQKTDGSFAPLWFGCESAKDELNSTYGTTHVLFACVGRIKEMIVIQARALTWLRSIQNPDGGFGGCAGAPSTAEETGLALRALVVSGVDPHEDCCTRAAKWLIEHQRPDGSWNPAPIGFYFAVLWYYEELYPLVYALGGLGALSRALKAKKEPNKQSAERVG